VVRYLIKFSGKKKYRDCILCIILIFCSERYSLFLFLQKFWTWS